MTARGAGADVIGRKLDNEADVAVFFSMSHRRHVYLNSLPKNGCTQNKKKKQLMSPFVIELTFDTRDYAIQKVVKLFQINLMP